MSKSWSILAKVAIFFAAVTLLSLGLCGLALSDKVSKDMAGVSIVGMIIGAGGLVLCAVAAVVIAIMAAVNGNSGPPQPPPPTFRQ